MNCSNPIEAGVLSDYWAGLLPAAEEEAVEEHLFACDRCGTRLREVIALADGVRSLAREGCLRMVVSDQYLESAAKQGRRIRQYSPPRGGAVQCTVTQADDLLIARFSANLSKLKRVDLCLCDERGVEQFRLPDIPIHASADSVIYQESMTFAKAAPTSKLIARLLTFDPEGREVLLGEYTFHHTRSLPGPGTWLMV